MFKGRKVEGTFEGVGEGVEGFDKLLVQLLAGPYREDEHVDEDGDDPTNCDRVEAIHGSPDRVAHPVARYNNQTVGEKDDPEAILVRD